MKTKTQEKAARSFDYQCRLASKCRHEKYQISCYSCPEEKTCYIQKSIEVSRAKM